MSAGGVSSLLSSALVSGMSTLFTDIASGSSDLASTISSSSSTSSAAAASGAASASSSSSSTSSLPHSLTPLSTLGEEVTHQLAWRVAGAFAVLAAIITSFQIRLHVRYNNNDALRKYILRILFMPLVYGLESWLGLRFPSIAFFMDACRECYESMVIYSFFSFLVEYIGGERALVRRLRQKAQFQHTFPFCCLERWEMGSEFLWHTKVGVLQFVVLKPLMAMISFALDGLYLYARSDGVWSWEMGEPYVLIVNNVSQTIALYSMAVFYWVMRDDLAPVNPVPKFLIVKSVVFLTYWQSVSLFILAKLGLIPGTTAQSQQEVLVQLQDFLVCVEMFAASIAHHFAFHYKEFHDPNRLHEPAPPIFKSLFQAVDVTDVFVDDVEMALGSHEVYEFDSNDASPMLEPSDPAALTAMATARGRSRSANARGGRLVGMRRSGVHLGGASTISASSSSSSSSLAGAASSSSSGASRATGAAGQGSTRHLRGGVAKGGGMRPFKLASASVSDRDRGTTARGGSSAMSGTTSADSSDDVGEGELSSSRGVSRRSASSRSRRQKSNSSSSVVPTTALASTSELSTRRVRRNAAVASSTAVSSAVDSSSSSSRSSRLSRRRESVNEEDDEEEEDIDEMHHTGQLVQQSHQAPLQQQQQAQQVQQVLQQQQQQQPELLQQQQQQQQHQQHQQQQHQQHQPSLQQHSHQPRVLSAAAAHAAAAIGAALGPSAALALAARGEAGEEPRRDRARASRRALEGDDAQEAAVRRLHGPNSPATLALKASAARVFDSAASTVLAVFGGDDRRGSGSSASAAAVISGSAMSPALGSTSAAAAPSSSASLSASSTRKAR